MGTSKLISGALLAQGAAFLLAVWWTKRLWRRELKRAVRAADAEGSGNASP